MTSEYDYLNDRQRRSVDELMIQGMSEDTAIRAALSTEERDDIHRRRSIGRRSGADLADMEAGRQAEDMG